MTSALNSKLDSFKNTIWSYYSENRRSMPWRDLDWDDAEAPYYIVVSEIMLQQTQVSRVTEKFKSFIRKFSDWKSLAKASTKDVLAEWSGLGYNRRALYLKRIAETINGNPNWNGNLPNTFEELRELPGIGPNTAGSILAFAFNIPRVFIETNVRSVFIHFFFPGPGLASPKVTDQQLIPLLEECLQDPKINENPREWYYALMDYGSFLKKEVSNPSRNSAHHVKQKPFKGSNRELRSKLLQEIMKGPRTFKVLEMGFDKQSLLKNLADLEKEGFIRKVGVKYKIA